MGGGKRYRVATVAGIPFYVGTSWLVIAGLYVYLQFLRLQNSSVAPSDAEAFALAVFGALLFFGGVVIHEAAHAVAARLQDIPVAAITLVFWGGATEAKASSKGPGAEFLVAFVGPASTLVLAGVFFVVGQQLDGLMGAIVRDLARLNLFFAGLNAIPGFPLDGGRMLLATAWGVSGSRRTGLRVVGYVGLGLGAVAAGLAIIAFTNQNDWWFILGYLAFLMITTGRSMDERIALRDRLSQGTVRDVMRPPPPTIPATTPLVDALDRHLRGADGKAFPVVEGDRVIGTVSMDSARKVGARDPMRPVRDGMSTLAETPTVAPDEKLDDALEWVGGRHGLVLDDGRLVGAISGRDIERWYGRRFEGVSDDEDETAPAATTPTTSPTAGDNAVPLPPRPDL
ncbi:MAG TPA: CBS domain-containing protein [Actinomycetota bacterium]|nr:CBS domain-containing protein [Actinomycetota bacterium]